QGGDEAPPACAEQRCEHTGLVDVPGSPLAGVGLLEGEKIEVEGAQHPPRLREGVRVSLSAPRGRGVLQVDGGDPQRAPPAHSSSAAAKLSDTEFMQYRSPVGVWGASGKTWPRCDPQRAQRTSVRTIPSERSSRSSTASESLAS